MPALQSGARLGPYEIVSPLGAGGMGEVYRARDTRLDRIVALKVLSRDLAANPTAVARFEREAKAIAALNHPHICTVHDIGRHDDTEYLVMEYVEGTTLAERLRSKGALPLNETVTIARQIAQALDKAHRHGIIHRDLKPANVMLTKSGVKLLDFGLAKMLQPASAASQFANMPTAQEITAEGAILGTLNYMAPEQLEGKEGDARVDIWAFGCVLYEMLTATRAFNHHSAAGVIGAIVSSPPPSVPLDTPALLRHLLTTCLTKDPEHRRQTIHDVALDLDAVTSTTAVAARSETRGRYNAVASGTMLLALALGGFAMYSWLTRVPAGTSPAPLRVDHSPAGVRVASLNDSIAFSPDGSRLAFVGVSGGEPRLFVRQMATGALDIVPDSELSRTSFWSPDGRSLGFFTGIAITDRKLKRFNVDQSTVQTITDLSNRNDVHAYGSWGADNVLLIGGTNAPLRKVSLATGAIVDATALNESDREAAHRYPEFLPDGRHFIYVASHADSTRLTAFVGAIDRPDLRVRLFDVESRVQYAVPGFLVFMRSGKLMAQRFDHEQTTLSGEPAVITNDTLRTLATGGSYFSVSDAGHLVFRRQSGDYRLEWFHRDGTAAPPIPAFETFNDTVIAPDARRVLFRRPEPNTVTQIWVWDVERGTTMRLTRAAAPPTRPCWAPGAERFAYAVRRDAQRYDFLVSDFAGNTTMLFQWSKHLDCSDWSRDGRYVLFETPGANAYSDVWAVDVAGDRKPFPVLTESYDEELAYFSPDGKWIVFESEESSPDDVYVQSFPKAGRRTLVSVNMGAAPRWVANGSEILYQRNRDVFAVSVTPQGGQLTFSQPRAVVRNMSFDFFSATADGQRLLLSTVEPAPLTIVANWPSLIGGQAPSR